MYYVKHEWQHKSHSFFEVTYWNSSEKATEKFNSVLRKEYKSLYKKNPSKFLSHQDIAQCIEDKIEGDMISDYSFSCSCCVIIPEDHENDEDDEDDEDQCDQSIKL